jgi:hypothetical protein
MNTLKLEKPIELMFEKHPLTDCEISVVENALKVKFPEIFIRLNKHCSYEYNNLVSFFKLDQSSTLIQM